MGAPPVPAEPTGLAEDPVATLNFQGGDLPSLTESLPPELKPVMAILEVGAVLSTTTVGRQREDQNSCGHPHMLSRLLNIQGTEGHLPEVSYKKKQ